MTVLCLIETDAGGGASDASVRAAIVAAELASSAGEDLAAAWFGPPEAVGADELASAGFERGYAIGSAQLAGYAPLAWARALAGLAAELPGGHGPASAVVAAATDRGSEVLAHLGAITGLPMAANCVSAVRSAPGECRLVRQRWAGSLIEDAVLDAPMALLTIAADAVAPAPAAAAPAPAADAPGAAAAAPAPAAAAPAPAADAPGAASPGAAVPESAGQGVEVAEVGVLTYEPVLSDGDLVVMATESADRRAGVSLASARVVVGGGRGVGGPEGFAVLEELAGLLGAAVGVSRVVTSQGWRPHKQQVGQTGTKITPELYLACGISGAIQHMAGCQGAKTIVAINTDPGAPIVAKADYAVIGDLHEVIPALIEALRARA